MRRKRKIPEKPRYVTITRKVYQLLAELEVSRFPVDPFKIIENLDSLYLEAWSELRDATGVSDPFGLKARKLDAETNVKRGTGEYLIVYDDTIGYLPRIRFTLAHEIGHIIMGHFTEFEKTSLREGLTHAEKIVLEREADAFAAELLAPRTILRRFPGMKNDPAWLKQTCFLSEQAADIRAEELKRVDFSYYRHEDQLHRNFYNYLEEKGIYPIPDHRLTEDTIIIPDELDDYLLCGYWPYIAATIGMYEKMPALQVAVASAVAFYDDGNMVLFVNNEETKNIAEQGKEVILKCLAKYANSPVTQISICVAQIRV